MARKLGMVTGLQEMEERYRLENVPRLIKISQLVPHEDNEYLFGEITDKNVSNLVEGIKTDGFTGAIFVWKMGEDKYQIFSGHRRKRAMEILGKEIIPCFVYEYPEAETVRRRMLLGNNIYTRGSINAAENHIYIARQIKYLEDTLRMEGFKGNMRKRMADEFGTSETKIHRYMSLLKCVDEIVELESDGIIPLKEISTIATLPEDEQLILAKSFSIEKERVEEKSSGKKERVKHTDFDNYLRDIGNIEKRWERNPVLRDEDKQLLINRLESVIASLRGS